jgi:C-lobe and N-lobe beta barrels of Tf-binding protein B
MSLLQGGSIVGGAKDSAAAVVASTNGVCGVNQQGCIPIITPATTTPPADPATTTGSAVGGNTTTNVAGIKTNKTIAIQAFDLDTPTDANTPAMSQITSALTPTFAATEAALMSNTKPKSLKFVINTNSASNGNWAVPVEMEEYAVGTRDLRWIYHGHTTIDFTNPAAYSILDTNGNPVRFDFAKAAFVYTAAGVTPTGSYNIGDPVDHVNNDFYWNQITPYMSSKANGGFQDKYREYWAKKGPSSGNRDEEMQVWSWKNSYSVKYQNNIGGGAPKQQAWSFGGNAATAMPASGKARYGGRFVGTSKTEGWTQQDNSKVNPNALWMVQGRSDVIANFDTSTIHGELSPESWTSEQDKKWYTWYTQEASSPGNMPGKPSVGTAAAPDYHQIYGTKIILDATIVADGTGTPTSPAVKNKFEGTTTLTNNFKPTDNPLYGGFFGANGNEVTGIFNVNGTTKELIGGTTGNVNQKEATITINGTFNGQCAPSPGFTCPP